MKVAIVGSRSITNLNLKEYLPDNITEIISGGAKGVDTLAKEYAINHNIKYKEFLPEYNKYGKAAPLKRNDLIVEHADVIYAFWNSNSRGTKYVIDLCQKQNKKIEIVLL